MRANNGLKWLCRFKDMVTETLRCVNWAVFCRITTATVTSETAMASKKSEKRIQAAISLVRNGSTYRHASSVTKLPKSTICSRIQAAIPRNQLVQASRSRLDTLTKVVDEMIVSLLIRYAERGLPLRRVHLKEAVSIIMARMLPVRRHLLKFKTLIPCDRFLREKRSPRMLTKRHRDAIEFVKPLCQEGVRFRACNPAVFTHRVSTLEKIIIEHHIDANRIWNCDETDATPQRDVNGNGSSGAYVTRNSTADAKMGNFLNQNRVTILAAVSASGHVAPPLFVFKGVRVPYRVVERRGHWVTETFSDYLPRHSVFRMRAEGGGVDTGNVFVWCTHFIKHVADLTSNNRKVLLILDGYRCPMKV